MFPCHEEKIKWDDYGEFIRYVNRLFPIYPQSLFQSESKCEIFDFTRRLAFLRETAALAMIAKKCDQPMTVWLHCAMLLF